jgi:hypothetical protein
VVEVARRNEDTTLLFQVEGNYMLKEVCSEDDVVHLNVLNDWHMFVFNLVCSRYSLLCIRNVVEVKIC